MSVIETRAPRAQTVVIRPARARPRLTRLAQGPLPWLSPILLLLLWQAAVSVGLLDRRFFSAPLTEVMPALLALARSGELWRDLSATLERIALGFCFGSAAGVVLGLLMGASLVLRRSLDPIVSALYVIPKIALFPLIMLIFGLGETSKVITVAIAAFFIVLISTAAAVVEIDPIYVEAGQNFGAGPLQMFRHIILPGALPGIVTGLRLAAGSCLIVIVAVEMVAAKSGLGFLIWQSWNTLVVENMWAGLVVVAALGILFTLLINGVGRLIMPWQRGSGRSGRN